MGGRILNIDPILTPDERYLILPYTLSLQVYSASDSLLHRKIELTFPSDRKDWDQIVSVRQSATNPSTVWVASAAGLVWQIDWRSGRGSEYPIQLDCELLRDLNSETISNGQHQQEILLCSAQKGRKWHIFALEIRGHAVVASRSVFSHPAVIANVLSVRSGQTLVASTERTVLVGSLRSESVSSVTDLDYEFFTFNTSDEITCIDLQVTERIHLNRKSQRQSGNTPVVNIVVGTARGGIFLYDDLLPQLRHLLSPKRQNSSLQPRKHHWHRKAVHAVKWSRDGNYVISGGSETTLVLYQLDTQKMDFLPHLSATIENIVISARGSAYVLHLNDNSAMVLSTNDMQPTAYISGIQTPLSPVPFSKDDLVRRIGQYAPHRLARTPAVMSPSDPSQILFCVGNAQQTSYSGSGASTPLVQTVDLATMQSISKQALTRTNPTDVNITAKGYAITEPRVTSVAYSHDGRWLATVDEWQPPSRDVEPLEGSSSDRREVYLKFWAVSSGQEAITDKTSDSKSSQSKAAARNLELISRINAPHQTGQVESVHDVAADPRTKRFATVGGDGVVRFWQPTIRQRDGVLVKGKNGRHLHSWTCTRSVYLHGNDFAGDLEAAASPVRGSGAVSFSDDGSTLACAIVHEHGSAVYVIDTESGKIRNSISGIVSGDVQGIEVLSSHLVVLSDSLMVYDLVFDELRYGVRLRTNDETHGPGASILAHLAADHRASRFAVAVTRNKPDAGRARSEIAVFNIDRCEPELVKKFPCPITSLVHATGSSGFLVLDSAAQLWSISESMDTNSMAFGQPLVELNLDGDGALQTTAEQVPVAILAGDAEESDDEGGMELDAPEDTVDGIFPAVLAPQKLTELFDAAPSFAMPPIEDMFYQVTQLLSSNSSVPVA
ncbi:WD domain-containing protein [Xylariomycetidae sp. FL0641]|nr:WD domain-containing protein [Xylariomycetidae sp. FL0641]